MYKKQNNEQIIEFVQPTAEMLGKTAPYETVGVKNIMKSMASEFLRNERTDFFVEVIRLARWFHFKTRREGHIVYVELVGVLPDDKHLQDNYTIDSYGRYENNGPLTKEKK